MSSGSVASSSTKRDGNDNDRSVSSSSSSSESPATTTGDESHDDGNDAKGDFNRVEMLVSREAATVRRAKIGVFVALVLAAAGIGTLIYFLTTGEEGSSCQQSVRQSLSASTR
jgi:hypothetical protein